MNRDQAKELIERYNEGLATAEERLWVENWYLDESLKYQLSDQESNFLHLKDEIWNGTLEKSGRRIKPKVLRLNVWSRIAAAVVLLIGCGLGLYFYNIGPKLKDGNAVVTDIAPGGNNAILTLANGKKIVLNDAAKGEISKQSGISVSKSNDGELIYTVVNGGEDVPTENTHNTISTPKGGQYTIILSDGTKVMLNSASSVTFPTSFKEGDRMVELNGEAYFEVAKHKNKRFRVVSGVQTVEVLGTHFNVNAYAEERTIKTTLLEGAVKVSTLKESALIEPGEQAVLDRADANSIVKRRVNINKETAWINGIFSFEGDDLKSVMRQVARWYDVNVIYVGPISEEKYFGEISRSSKLSEVFNILELNNVNFDVVGKTVKVSYNQRLQQQAQNQ
ncbi:FecR family protein [Pedobacter hiemivivus]|uniref:FecR family protein n=1 Tax=Pedobacter hiemivivus TaxID=2530454 RepID=A0A4R0N814_9SPHI|nr:FecR family protein [Pedobacter hiemivivus]TCC96279.1 FecR family protein [Pedobacter hiemivivus]